MNDQRSLPDNIYGSFRDLGIDLYCYGAVDSTNKMARELAAERIPSGAVMLIAESQTEGRGRLGRSFYSPPATGLYMTLLIPDDNSYSFNGFTAIAAVEVRRAIKHVMKKDTEIKWVNDIYFEDRKVAGILAESFFCADRRYVALGIGINICTADFPNELSALAGALRRDAYESDGDARADALALAYCIGKGMLEALGKEDIAQYMEEYRKYSCVIGREIEYTRDGEIKRALAVGIDGDGGLIVRADGTDETLIGGEISVRLAGK